MTRRYKGLKIFIIVFLIISGLIFYSPHFLLYASDYKKADAIIILLGPDFKARRKEANELIHKGMANYLIIPAYHKIYAIYDNGKGQNALPPLYSPKKNNIPSYPGFYEDTHIELIEARQTMSLYGLKSAIFVSSPYHMRRIKLMAMKVFDVGKNAFYFVPTRYENAPQNIWELSPIEWKKVRREYSKILWFYIYTFWSDYVGYD